MIFIDRIKKLLKNNGITKNKMLVDLQLGKNSFINWEFRNTVPGGDTLAKIADYFNVSIDYLLGRTDVPTMGTQTSDSSITPREKAILLAYREKKDMQAAVERLLDVNPSPSQSPEDPQDAQLDRIIKLVDARIANGELDPKNAKIAAFGGYKQTATGKEAEELAEIKRLVQDVLEEQRKQGNK